MTLDPKKIEQWAREADDAAYNFRVEHSNDPTPWSAIRDEHFALLAMEDAFEMAAKEARARAERCGGKAHPVSVGEAVSASIRALAEREKETK